MDATNLTLPVAFLAGLLSFLSPCVLPLVPAYMGYLGGTRILSEAGTGAKRDTAKAFFHSLAFVLGFGLVFILLGALANLLGRFLFDFEIFRILLQRVGGVLLVVFGMRLMAAGWGWVRWLAGAVLTAGAAFVLSSGLITSGGFESTESIRTGLEVGVMMGLVVLAGADWGTFRRVVLAVMAGLFNFLASSDSDSLVPNLVVSLLIPLTVIFFNRAEIFYTEKRIDLRENEQTGYLRSLLFGVVFAAGWTPCIGPILGGIFALASQLDTVGQGVLLLVAYTLGLGIPFLLVGVAVGPLSKWLRRMNRYLGIVSVVSGVLLVLMGLMIFTGSLGFLSQYGNLFELEL